MSWITDVRTVTNTAKAGITAVSNDIQNTFSINANKTIDMIDSFFTNGYSIVGINANLIETVMYPAIDGYVDAINKQLDRLVNYEPEVAFKGTEIVGALREYIDAVKVLCSNIVSHMLAFKDELAAVKAAYDSRDTSTASNLRTQAESARSQQTAYSVSGN